eukprot:1605859-Rhodomonas_salina.2
MVLKRVGARLTQYNGDSTSPLTSTRVRVSNRSPAIAPYQAQYRALRHSTIPSSVPRPTHRHIVSQA